MIIFRLGIPLAGFRPYEARDYQETLPLPPHSTIFGCFLSVLGVERRESAPYGGTRLAVAGQTGERSRVVRKMRRDPANPKKGREGIPSFRPEYQELLCDVHLWVGVERGTAERDLAAELADALARPDRLDRHGVVSLGESCFMVDTIERVVAAPNGLMVLRPRPDGSLSLTTWVDFEHRTGTRRARVEPTVGTLKPEDGIPVGP